MTTTLTGIYPVSGNGPALSDHEMALLSSLPEHAQVSRLATHAELLASIVSMARRHDHSLDIDHAADTGFVATVARDLRVVANIKGTGEQTFYCQSASTALIRQLAEEIAVTCGPQLVLPVHGDEDGVLVVPRTAAAD